MIDENEEKIKEKVGQAVSVSRRLIQTRASKERTWALVNWILLENTLLQQHMKEKVSAAGANRRSFPLHEWMKKRKRTARALKERISVQHCGPVRKRT